MKFKIIALSIVILLINSCSHKQNEKKFISLAYVALYQLNFNQINARDVAPFLDKYNWNGITDVAIIGGVFLAGSDGSIVAKWNEESWPPVNLEPDYMGRPSNEPTKRGWLCSKEVVKATFNYFQSKGMKMWLSQSAASWMSGGSLSTVCKDSILTKKYALNLYHLAQEFNCVGVDLDWEFPPTEREAEGYVQLMKELKALGTKVSVCAIQPAKGRLYKDIAMEVSANIGDNPSRFMDWEEIVREGVVDQINVMQYHGYNSESKQMDVEVKKEKMSEWEQAFPDEFTSNNRVDMMCGIGYYSFLIPKDGVTQKRGYMTIPQIYEEYGEELLNSRVVGDHTLWTTNDVREIVRHATDMGWSGVFTWLVTHDAQLDMPQQYSRQQTLSNEVDSIWANE